MWIEILRGVQIALAGVVVGMTAQVFVVYFEKARKLDSVSGRMPRHVAGISLSYLMMVLITGGTQLEFLLIDHPATWRLVACPIAYGIGIYALSRVILIVSERRETPRRRAMDPV